MGGTILIKQSPKRLILAFLCHLFIASPCTADQNVDDLCYSYHVSHDKSPSYDINDASSLIFSSIHHSMRQFGSSISYRSNCAFLATIPAGVQLYHGSSKEQPPSEGLKWLAFEPEHSMLFSHPSEHWSQAFKTTNELDQLVLHDNFNEDDHLRLEDQSPRSDKKRNIWQNFLHNEGWGYLHTYSTTRSLRLLYLDGSSAAKTVLGTLDLQDKVILQDRFNLSTDLADDNVRAGEICRVAREEWGGNVDGFIRMEAGFEVIMCSIADSGLESIRERTIATPKVKDAFATYKALAQRFHNIGRDRVTVHYDQFFTLYGLRRRSLQDLKAEMTNLVIGEVTERRVNWQAVTDMIVQRFAVPLRLLSTPEAWSSKEDFNNEAARLLLPFIDQRGRNREAEVARCSAYFLPSPSTHQTSPASSSILHISRLICAELISSIDDDARLPTAIARLSRLRRYLDWSIWRDCSPSCADHEVCHVPVWPFSLALDRRRPPRCVNQSEFFRLAVEEVFTASVSTKI